MHRKNPYFLLQESPLQDEGDTLISKKFLSQDQLIIARIESQNSRRPLKQVLLDLGFLEETHLKDFFHQTHKIETVDLKNFVIEHNLIRPFPKTLAEKLKAIPLYQKGTEMGIAMADPTHLLSLDELQHHVGNILEIKPYFAKESAIFEAIQQHYDQNLEVTEILKELASPKENTLSESPIVRLFQSILLEAIQKNASDIHFEPDDYYVRLRYRIDGVLHPAFQFHKNFWESLCVHIKVFSGMNIAESRLPQAGRFSIHVADRPLDFRVATHPTRQGENIVIRILDQATALVPLENLGFSEQSLDLLNRIVQRPEGMIIVTGPTGVGKTTTLYSLLHKISSPSVNIMTLEQPIEYKMPLVRQTEIKEAGGLTFAEGIRSILRQDPDVIFVGEVRDADTAQMACRAAMTGHQVYTTLHTNSVFGVVERLMDLGVSRTILGNNIIGILSQRLVRRLCPTCKQETILTPTEQDLLGIENGPIYRAHGCPDCFETGYRGRLPLVEILECSGDINRHISEDKDLFSLEEKAKKQGFKSLKEHGIDALKAGETSMEELLRNVDFG
ncbi:MAG: GspE/PulE family protein [Alphaproteobacteria bacterium]